MESIWNPPPHSEKGKKFQKKKSGEKVGGKKRRADSYIIYIASIKPVKLKIWFNTGNFMKLTEI